MANYSIRDLERLSGIKAHTIRMWEKRYNVIEPERSETNIRSYSNEELKKLLNIAILNSNGIRISKIVGMSPEDMHKKVIELSHEKVSEVTQIESLVIAMLEMDEARFERILSNSILRLGFEKTFNQIISPFLYKVGVLWQTGSVLPAQEHYISNLIRQKLIVAIDGQGMMEKENHKKFLLFLPENELHEIGLLYYSYLIKKEGHRIIYLGQSVPLSDLTRVVEHQNPDYLITSVIGVCSKEEINSTIHSILENVPDLPLLITNQLENDGSLIENDRLRINQGPGEFHNWLKELK